MIQIVSVAIGFIWSVTSSIIYLFSTWLLGWIILGKLWKNSAWYVQLGLGMGMGLVISIILLDIMVGVMGRYGHGVMGLVLLLSFVYGIKVRLRIKKVMIISINWLLKNKSVLVILVMTTVAVWLSIAGSGWPTAGGFGYQPTIMHDSLWHLALIKSLQNNNPPVHPSSSGLILSNYHYLYDLWLANWQFLTRINLQDLYFRISSWFVLVFVSLSSLTLIRFLVHRKAVIFANLWLIILWWAGSLGYLIPLFLAEANWGESSFWVSQTFVMLVNPQLLISFGLLSCLMLLGMWPLTNKLNKGQWFGWLSSVSALLYVIAGAKFYGVIFGILWMTALVVYYLWRKIIGLKHFLIIVGTLTMTGLVILWRFVDLSKSSLIWAPLWFVTTMVAVEDRLPIRELVLREQHYKEVGAWHYLILIKTVETIIFYVGNLGVRILGLVIGPVLWLNHRAKSKVLINPFFWFVILCLAIISSVIPLLFIQHGVVWNSIQFWYYTLFFADFLLVGVLGYWWVATRRPKIAKTLILILLIFNSLMFFVHMSTQFRWSEKIPIQAVEVSKMLGQNDHLVVCPQIENTSIYFESSFFSVFSKAQVELIDPVQIQLLGLDGDGRVAKLKSTFERHRGSDLFNKLPENTTAVLCNREYFGNFDDISNKVLYQDEKLVMMRVD